MTIIWCSIKKHISKARSLLAMGNVVTPTLANIVMDNVATETVNKLKHIICMVNVYENNTLLIVKEVNTSKS